MRNTPLAIAGSLAALLALVPQAGAQPYAGYYAPYPPVVVMAPAPPLYPPAPYYAPPGYYTPPPVAPYAAPQYGYLPPAPSYYAPPEPLPIPPRPRSCGKYRYWNGDYCADARYERPYVGPKL